MRLQARIRTLAFAHGSVLRVPRNTRWPRSETGPRPSPALAPSFAGDSERGGGQLHVGVSPRLAKLRVGRRGLGRFALRLETLSEAEQRPAIVGIAPQVFAVDRF